MIEIAIASFVIFLLITAFVKQPWNWLLLLAIFGLFFALFWLNFFLSILAAPRAVSAGDSVSLAFVPVATVGGFLAGSLMKLLRHGRASRSLKRADSWWWLGIGLIIVWILLGVIELTTASDTTQSMSGSLQALPDFMLALMAALSVFMKPAITAKGIRASAFDLGEWKQIKSYEWQGDKLVLHLKARFLPRWLNRV
jgi:hypothetical protein